MLFPSPDAELLGDRGGERGLGGEGQELCRYAYPNTTYAQIKRHWAKPNPTRDLIVGGPLPEDWEVIETKIFATYLRNIGVTVEQFNANRNNQAQLDEWWQGWQGLPNHMATTPCIRPANPEEIETYTAVQRDRQRHEQTARILKNWGFDSYGASPWASQVPTDDNDRRRRALQAWEEIRRTFRDLGLLKGSFFDYEEEFRATFCDNVPTSGRGLSRVAGMTDLKEQLMHEVLGPFKDPDLYREYRVSLPNGILFYGPPGCGKTYIARALAEELGWSFQYCRPSDVASPYIHDTVSKIRALFSTAIEKAPSIVFIDEFEAFVPARSELGGHQQYKAEEVNEFLANLEGCAERNVLVIAATNEPEKIDHAVRRSGRFDKLILIQPPDAEARRAMLVFYLNDRPVDASLDAGGIAAVLEGYSASDIKLLVDEAARMALKQRKLISTSTMLAALDLIPPSITAEAVQKYSEFRSRGS